MSPPFRLRPLRARAPCLAPPPWNPRLQGNGRPAGRFRRLSAAAVTGYVRSMSAPGDLAEAAQAPTATHAQLFVSFTKIALSGFGGTIAWAHREIVHQRRWMSEEEFTEMLSLAQF